MKMPTRVKILYCENNVDGTIGGSYYSLLYLVQGLDKSRYEPIVVFYSQHSLLQAFRDAGVETLVWERARPFTFGNSMRLGVLRSPLSIVRRTLNLLYTFVFPALARAWFLIRHRIDLVHLNNSILVNHDWMFAARLTGRPCLSHERGINARYPDAAKHFGRRLAAIVCISSAVREAMQKAGADFGNLVTMHNGLDPAALRVKTTPNEIRTAFGLEPGAPVVGMTGNIKVWKGQDTLIRAIDHVRRRFPSVRCLIVGDTSPVDREYGRTIRELVSSLGLDRHILFAGFQRNIADFVTLFDVVVHASVHPEPFGRVILEAMAFRKPVVAANAGAVTEIIDDGLTGLTFPPGDAEALAKQIVRLLENREEAVRLGENGFDRLMKEFHIDRNLEATERLYGKLLSAPS
jgi:glycosyltransferase involved in cell wall biosynthesis